MNKNIMRAMGFNKEVDAIEAGRCPMCSEPINTDDFKDDLSRREYAISGLCQSCQDWVFNPTEDLDEDGILDLDEVSCEYQTYNDLDFNSLSTEIDSGRYS